MGWSGRAPTLPAIECWERAPKTRSSPAPRANIHDGPEQMLQSKAGYIDARPLTASSAKPLATHGRTIHWVKLRNTQHEQMSSALHPTTDVGLARAKGVTRIDGVGAYNPCRRYLGKSRFGPFRNVTRLGGSLAVLSFAWG